jgi:acetyl-CoA carboxylase/biotin carboxylase 1
MLTDGSFSISQVEHPVTEGITETNIPSIQLMVGMGIPLWRMPELRTSFDQDPKGDQYFDIENTPQRLPSHHVIAVRITSENAGDGFKPTAGRVDEVSQWSNLLCCVRGAV